MPSAFFNFNKIVTSIFVWMMTAFLFSSCTNNESLFSDTKYQFPGLSSANIDELGAVTLAWEKVPTEKNGISYQVFRRAAQGAPMDFSSVWQTTSENSYRIAAYDVESSYCYAVRYAQATGTDDLNVKEICPALPYISGFAGIKTAVSSGSRTATVTWDLPTTGAAEVVSFVVYSGSGFTTVLDSAKGTSTSITVVDLPPDEVVTLGVRLVDKFGRQDKNTHTIDVSVLNGEIPQFGGIKDAVASSSTGCVTLSWNPPGGKIKQLNVYSNLGPNNTTPTVTSFATPLVSITNATLMSKEVCGLGDDLAHTFSIRAQSTGGQEETNVIQKTVVLPDAGAPIFDGIATANFVAGKATITWAAALGEVAQYKIFYQQGSTINFATASTVTASSTVTTTDLVGLLDSQNYTFAVRAIDSRSQSDTNIAKITRYSGDTTPPVFLNYVNGSTQSTSESNIALVFNKSTETDVSYYSIKTRVVGLTTWTENQKVFQNSTTDPVTVNVGGLTGGTSYELLVKVVDSSLNESTNTSVITRTTLDTTPPSFAGIKTTSGLAGTPTTAVITWDAATDNSGIQEYRIYYATQAISSLTLNKGLFSGGATQTVGGVSVTMSGAITSGTSTNLVGMTSNTTYYLVMHAIDNQGNEDGNTSQNQYAIPDVTPPTIPSGVAFSPAQSGATSSLTFNVTGSATQGNTVRVYADGTMMSQQQLNAGTGFNIAVTLPSVSGNYVITVKQENAVGILSGSATVGTYVLDVTGPTITLVSPASPVKIGGPSSSVDAASFVFKCSETCNYSLKDGSTAITSGSAAADTNTTISFTSSELQAGDGIHTLVLTVADNAGNASTQNVGITVDTQAPLNVTGLIAVRNEETETYQLTWQNNALDATDVIHIRLATGTLSPPSASTGSAFATNLPFNTTSRSGAYATEKIASFTVQVCDAVGNCADVTSCPSCKASIDANWTYQNISEGNMLRAATWDLAGGSPVVFRIGQSATLSEVTNWNGVASSLSGGGVITEGSPGCTRDSCLLQFSNNVTDPPWSQRYFRIAGYYNSSGGTGVRLSKIRYWAKVPTGMVFVSKNEWPSGQDSNFTPATTYNYPNKFDYAIDKYEASLLGGNPSVSEQIGYDTSYPNSNVNVAVSVANSLPSHASLYSWKQACLNRSYEAGYNDFATINDLSNASKGTRRTPNPKRKFHLATGLEWTVAAAETPKTFTQHYCNLENRVGSVISSDNATFETDRCISKFGMQNAFGNIAEITDEMIRNGRRGALVRYFGTSAEEALLSANVLPWSTASAIDSTNSNLDYDYNAAYMKAGSATSIASFTFPNQYSDTQNWMPMRGGTYHTGAASTNERIMMSTYPPETFVAAHLNGGRCAIEAPQNQPVVHYLEDDTNITNEVRIYWNADGVEPNAAVRLGYSDNVADLVAWTGTSSVPANGGIITDFSTCTSYTPTARYSGKYCLTTAVDRIYKLCIENKNPLGVSMGAPVCSQHIYSYSGGSNRPALTPMFDAGRGITLQNDSAGRYARFYTGPSGGTNYGRLRIAYSAYKDEIDRWQGESTTFLTGAVTDDFTSSCGSYTGPVGLTSGVDYGYYFCVDLGAFPKWTKMFFKFAIRNGTDYGVNEAAGPWWTTETQAHAYVPDGMTFVARELWGSEYSSLPYCTGTASSYLVSLDSTTPSHQLLGCRYDFAIDKFEAVPDGAEDNTNLLVSGGGSGATAMSHNTTTANVPARTTSAPILYWRSWSMFKKACQNSTSRTSGWIGASTATKIRMATGTEWIVASDGTIESPLGDEAICNQANSGAIGTSWPKCVSKFGGYDYIGNNGEYTDEIEFDTNTTTGATTFQRFYGTPSVFSLSSVTLPVTGGWVSTYAVDFLTGLIGVGGSDLGDWFYYTAAQEISKGNVLYRGSTYFSTSTHDGRWFLYHVTSDSSHNSSRCSLAAP